MFKQLDEKDRSKCRRVRQERRTDFLLLTLSLTHTQPHIQTKYFIFSAKREFTINLISCSNKLRLSPKSLDSNPNNKIIVSDKDKDKRILL